MSLFTITAYIAIGIISISILLTLIRFIKGPSLPDRVISLDVFSANLLAGLAVYSVLAEEKSYLNVALIMSLITFVGTMTFAYYLVQKRQKPKRDDSRHS
jgi:multicomponent Na+:H+ antiporter subunit F